MDEDEMDRIASKLVKQAMVDAAFDGMEREVEFGGFRYTITAAMKVTAVMVDRRIDDDDFRSPMPGGD